MIPDTAWFLNSFQLSPDIGIIDFTDMKTKGKMNKPSTARSNFDLAVYDRDPSLGTVLAARYSEV